MARSPNDNQIDLVSVEVLVKGSQIPDEYVIAGIEINLEVNKIASAVVELLDGNPSEEDFAISSSAVFVPGDELSIKVGYQTDSTEIYKGIIVSHRIKVGRSQHSKLIVKCYDKSLKMTTHRKNAYFLESKDSDVINTLIGNAGLSKEVESTAYQHKEIIQYNATDWDFMLTRAEMNGLIVLTQNGKVLVKKPDTSGSAAISLTYGTDIHTVDLDLNAQHQLPAVECLAWDPGTQKMVSGKSAEPSLNEMGNITGKKLSEVLGGDDFQLHTSGQLEAAMLNDWASSRLLKSRLARIRGTISCQGVSELLPNSILEIKGLGDRFNGDAYVSGVKHEVKDGNWTVTAKIGLNPNWFSESQPDVMLPPASGILPGVDGVHVGTVKQIHEDPDGEHRVQVDVPTIAESGDGVWARMVQIYATNEAGTFFWPEVGDEVLLGFLNADPRFPVILGKLYSKQNVPPYTADEPNTYKAIVTRSQMKFVFNDEDIIVWIETPGGNSFTISDKDESITLADQHGSTIVMEADGITIDSAKDINIKAQGLINVEATQDVSIKSSGGDVSTEGLNVNNKAQIAFKAEGSATAELKASGQTTVKGAIVMIN
jgi:Rhs element Vgr protein